MKRFLVSAALMLLKLLSLFAFSGCAEVTAEPTLRTSVRPEAKVEPEPPKPLPEWKDEPRDTRPIIRGYVTDNCPPCAQMKHEAESDDARRWVFVLPSLWPSWVRDKAEAEGVPIVHWEGKRGWRCMVGWPGMAEFNRTYEASQKRHEVSYRPAKVQVPVQRRGLYYGPGVGSAFDWPGDLRTHLTHSPHNLSRATVDSWSDGQCIAWHDRWHVTNEPRQRRRR
jgi:hypothetical protein